VDPVELPCGHAYCASPCLVELRRQGVAQGCPQCRGEVPLGLDGLFDLAFRAYLRIRGMVTRGEVAWASLPAAAQEELDGAVAMLTEAAAQGHEEAEGMITLVKWDPGDSAAQNNLGRLLYVERKDMDGAEAAYRAAIAADPGCAAAHDNLGVLLEDERKDMDGAEAAYRAAIAADPGHANAHYNLGNLLNKDERQDFDGAEAAYRAAIAADPGLAKAHTNLGVLLENERGDLDGVEAAYRAAIAADPGYADAHFNLGCAYRNGEGVLNRSSVRLSGLPRRPSKGAPTCTMPSVSC
jgi:tetratricopeptide (TPR) repeat protein